MKLTADDFGYIHWDKDSGGPELFELIIHGRSKSDCDKIKQQILENQEKAIKFMRWMDTIDRIKKRTGILMSNSELIEKAEKWDKAGFTKGGTSYNELERENINLKERLEDYEKAYTIPEIEKYRQEIRDNKQKLEEIMKVVNDGVDVPIEILNILEQTND